MSGEVWKIAEIEIKTAGENFEVSKQTSCVKAVSTELDTEKIAVMLGAAAAEEKPRYFAFWQVLKAWTGRDGTKNRKS